MASLDVTPVLTAGDTPAGLHCDRVCDRLTTLLIATIVIVMIILIAYRMKWLNWALPAKYRRGNCGAVGDSTKKKKAGRTVIVGGAGSNIKTGPGWATPPPPPATPGPTVFVGSAGGIQAAPGWATPPAEGFVGNLSRTDQGKPTLIYATSHARWPMMNLGTYV